MRDSLSLEIVFSFFLSFLARTRDAPACLRHSAVAQLASRVASPAKDSSDYAQRDRVTLPTPNHRPRFAFRSLLKTTVRFKHPIRTIESSKDSHGPWLSRTLSIVLATHCLNQSQKPTELQILSSDVGRCAAATCATRTVPWPAWTVFRDRLARSRARVCAYSVVSQGRRCSAKIQTARRARVDARRTQPESTVRAVSERVQHTGAVLRYCEQSWDASISRFFTQEFLSFS